MPSQHRIRQGQNEIVDVTGWAEDAENPYYPEGKQPKKLLVSPGGNLHPFLLPNHKYLFKTPQGWQQRQIWSELIAYELSRSAGLTVPPCFLAVDRSNNQVGVLVEFFYGYANEPEKRFIPGSDFYHAWLSGGYDRRKGRPHAMRSNLLFARSLGIESFREWWARTYFFDALIGNSDRHPDNWGLLAETKAGGNYIYEMAPLFDNGSSLSYGEGDEQLQRIADLDAYISRGRHHCGLLADDMKGAHHQELCASFMKSFGQSGLVDDSIHRWRH